MSVKAASVLIEAEVVAATADERDAVRASLAPLVATPAAASALLNVTVEEPPQLTTSAEAEALSSAAIIGIGVGAFGLCAGCVVWLLCLSRLRPRSPTAGTAQRAAGEQGALVLAASKI